jgi:hypothetical protein
MTISVEKIELKQNKNKNYIDFTKITRFHQNYEKLEGKTQEFFTRVLIREIQSLN